VDTAAGIIERGAAGFGVTLDARQLALLERHVALLLKWNKTINLTAITDPAEVAEKHVVDSLAVAPLVPPGRLLDAGAGGGFPGVPLRIARADLDVLMVDSVQKKVAFLKAVTADLALPGLRARALRLGGRPVEEGMPRFHAAIARAFAAPAEWLDLAEPYLLPGGSAFCLLGARDQAPEERGGLRRFREVEYRLPVSGAQRKVVEYRLAEASARPLR
jgi:16S rRNA (guanine527-N7)-methyltransferase